jgi:dihydrofolate synthase/folylpolyglutamate synthase
MNYTETLEFLYARLATFHLQGGNAYKPGLDNTLRLMEHLQNPHRKFKSIHVAGTNGKGSVSHFLAAILQSAGYKVGLYTSPHLVDFGERIRINGTKIDPQYVIDFVANNNDIFESINPSFFEATMAMAFQYFADNEVDIAVIEVGLGGRLDSTNIISPLLSVITNISYDHVGFLGDTLDKIAFEKAGIIKPNTPVVIGEALAETKAVFIQKAQHENAPLHFAEDKHLISFKCFENGKMVVLSNQLGQIKVGLSGMYQLKNLATVLSAVHQLQVLGFNIDNASLLRGLSDVIELTGLQGRWQVIQSSPLLILDTGHNIGGMQDIVAQLTSIRCDRLHLVFGMVNDKDISSVLALLPQNASYYFTQATIQRAMPAEELMKKASEFGLRGTFYDNVKQAITEAKNAATSDDCIFVGGSNFVVGEALLALEYVN